MDQEEEAAAGGQLSFTDSGHTEAGRRHHHLHRHALCCLTSADSTTSGSCDAIYSMQATQAPPQEHDVRARRAGGGALTPDDCAEPRETPPTPPEDHAEPEETPRWRTSAAPSRRRCRDSRKGSSCVHKLSGGGNAVLDLCVLYS